MKAEELIRGEWYDFRGKDADAVAAKFHHCSDHGDGSKCYFHFSEFIRGDEHEFYNGSWTTKDAKGLIPMSEIEKYLPYKTEPVYEIY